MIRQRCKGDRCERKIAQFTNEMDYIYWMQHFYSKCFAVCNCSHSGGSKLPCKILAKQGPFDMWTEGGRGSNYQPVTGWLI